tara:strand:- start:7410 stop:7646 length:237 start_codon:yes stop_codon:yes gene_type:complete
MTDSKIINELPGTKVGYYHIDEQMTEDGYFRLTIQDVRDGKELALDVDLETHIKILEFLETRQHLGSLDTLANRSNNS